MALKQLIEFPELQKLIDMHGQQHDPEDQRFQLLTEEEKADRLEALLERAATRYLAEEFHGDGNYRRGIAYGRYRSGKNN